MSYDTNTKEVIQFKRRIAAGETVILSERVKAPGTIEGLRVRFYPGQELALRVKPYVQHKGQKIEQFITYVEGGDDYLSGDDDREEYGVVMSVDYDDEIKIKVVNTSTTYAYTLNVAVTIDYYAGQDRVIGGVING